MKISKHKLIFRKEFFGSIIYNTKSKDYYFFNFDSTLAIKKILHHNYKNNPELEEFKKELLKNNLLSSNFTFLNNKKKNILSAPLRVFIDITYKCNLKCKHCFTDSGERNPDELSTKELFKLISQMRKTGTHLLSIAGGEPLLRDDIFQVIKYAKNNFIDVSLTTNGLLINQKIATKLNQLKLKTITISVDGLEKSHDQIRGKGNFKKTIKGIKTLKKFCYTSKIAIKTTVNSLNINEYEEIIKLAEKLKLDSVKFNPIRLFGRTINNRDLLIDQKQYINFLNNVQKIKTKVNIGLPKTPLDNRKYEFIHLGFGCTGGKETCNINPNGNFSPCAFLGNDFIIGNIKTQSFLNLWNKVTKIVNFCGNETCNYCPTYKNCRGGCRSRALLEYGNINSIDPLCTLKKTENNNLTVRREKNHFIVYNHSSKQYKKYNKFTEINTTHPRIIKNKQFRKIKNAFQVPLKIFFDVTNKCNSKCLHCYNNSGKALPNEIKLKVIEKLAKQMNKLGICQISLAGGEPFTRDDIFKIINLFNVYNIDVSITTNGLCLTKEKVNLLSNLDTKSITVSIDAVERDSYNRIRGVNKFNLLNNNLKYLRKKFKGELSMRFSIMRNNCQPNKIFKYAASKKFDYLKINKTHLLGRFIKNQDYILSDKEYDALINKFDRLKDNYSLNLELPREKYLDKNKKLPCSAGKKTIYISPDGRVFPCPFISSDYLFGDLTKESLNKIISKNKSFNVNNKFCKNCPAMKKSHNITKKSLI